MAIYYQGLPKPPTRRRGCLAGFFPQKNAYALGHVFRVLTILENIQQLFGNDILSLKGSVGIFLAFLENGEAPQVFSQPPLRSKRLY